MRFDEWLTATSISNATFARLIGVSRETIGRWRTGDRFPNREAQAAIFKMSDGLVTPNDWVGVGNNPATDTPVPDTPALDTRDPAA